jgi:hypothetical protein
LLEVITCGDIPAFETFVAAWLGDCGQSCVNTVEVEGCVEPVCEPVYLFPVLTTNFTPNVTEFCD